MCKTKVCHIETMAFRTKFSPTYSLKKDIPASLGCSLLTRKMVSSAIFWSFFIINNINKVG
jgi:hypothetical protein